MTEYVIYDEEYDTMSATYQKWDDVSGMVDSIYELILEVTEGVVNRVYLYNPDATDKFQSSDSNYVGMSLEEIRG